MSRRRLSCHEGAAEEAAVAAGRPQHSPSCVTLHVLAPHNKLPHLASRNGLAAGQHEHDHKSSQISHYKKNLSSRGKYIR